jgi:hypothetical protein
MKPNRLSFKAVSLNDGRVLIMGGYTIRLVENAIWRNSAKTTSSCEYLDLETLQFAHGPSLPEEGNEMTIMEWADLHRFAYITPLTVIHHRELGFDAIKLYNGNVLFGGAGANQEKICLLEFYKDGVYDKNPQWTVFENVNLSSNFHLRLCYSFVELSQEYVAIVYKTRALHSLRENAFPPDYNYAILLNMKTRKLEPEKVLCWRASDGFYGVGAI